MILSFSPKYFNVVGMFWVNYFIYTSCVPTFFAVVLELWSLLLLPLQVITTAFLLLINIVINIALALIPGVGLIVNAYNVSSSTVYVIAAIYFYFFVPWDEIPKLYPDGWLRQEVDEFYHSILTIA